MATKFYVGCDISKLTIDFALYHGSSFIEHCKIGNAEKEITELLKRYKAEYNCNPRNSIICAEAMGVYATHLRNAATRKNYRYWEESPLQIKYSLGIARGKTDKIDSERIANYARRFETKFKQWAPPRAEIIELKRLLAARKKLMKLKHIVSMQLKETDVYLSKTQAKYMTELYSKTLAGIKADSEIVESRILDLIKSDLVFARQMKILTSIPQVGKQLAILFISETNEFKDFPSAKHFASFAGVAPFEISSGTALRKIKTSKIAGRGIKSAMHIAVLGATCETKKQNVFKKYYFEKLAEGKAKFSILNAIKNKIIKVAFACINSDELFKENAKWAS